MPYDICRYFCLHSHTSTICHTISVAISLCTHTHLNMPYDICCYFSLQSHTSTICHTISFAISVCTHTHLQNAEKYQWLFLSPLTHIYNMPHNMSCYFPLHCHTSKICRTISVAIYLCTPTHLQYATQYQLLFLSALPHIYNMPYNISCYFPLHSHTSTIIRII